MIGEASGIVPDRGMNVLSRGNLNTLMNLNEDDLTQDNRPATNAQAMANTRLSADTPKGLLAGSVVSVGDSGVAVKAAKADYDVIGVVLNNAVGYPFESSSGVASGKCPYLHGASSVFTTDLYETHTEAAAAQTYLAGDRLYVSPNGLLTRESGGSVVVGICLIAPSTSDPFMAVQMRI